MRELLTGLLDLVYPRHCIGCGVRLSAGPETCLCPVCAALIERLDGDQCHRCGGRVGPHAGGWRACASCGGREDLAFALGTSAVRYNAMARSVVHRLKFGGDLSPVSWMARELAEKLRRMDWLSEVDLIVPVPLHWTRRLQRRFNQSELIAVGVGRNLGLPVACRALRRVRRAPPQSTLTGNPRRENVKDAYRARNAACLADRVILLVDDVMSTCSTASECARTLKRAGARKVHVAVFAR